MVATTRQPLLRPTADQAESTALGHDAPVGNRRGRRPIRPGMDLTRTATPPSRPPIGAKVMTMRPVGWRSRTAALIATLSAAMILLSSCALAAKEAFHIILQIGEDVLVQKGEDYLKNIFSPKDANGDATVVISITNGDGDGVGSTYAVNGVGKITIANVNVRSHSGGIHIVADGNGLAVTVDGGADATIEITSSSGSGNAQTFDRAGDQAASINGVLQWSSRSRSALGHALDRLNACRDIGEATSSLRNIASERARQADALADIDVSQLPDGESLRDTLVEALASSRDADLAFVRWGEAEQSGCGDGRDHRNDGMSYSRDADVAKDRFVGKWNRTAPRYGLPRYRGRQI